MTNISKFDEPRLPPKGRFYSALRETDIRRRLRHLDAFGLLINVKQWQTFTTHISRLTSYSWPTCLRIFDQFACKIMNLILLISIPLQACLFKPGLKWLVQNRTYLQTPRCTCSLKTTSGVAYRWSVISCAFYTRSWPIFTEWTDSRTDSTTLSCVYHLSTDDLPWRNFLSPQCRNCSRDPDNAHLGSTNSSQD